MMNAPFTRRRWIQIGGVTLGGLKFGLSRVFSADSDTEISGRAMQAHRLIEAQIQQGNVAAAAFLVRRGKFEFARAYGKAKVETPFLIASPTKPMTVSAVMWLRDRGQLQLTDAVQKFL